MLNVTFRELKETLLGGGGGGDTGEVQKKYSRKGKLNEKKFHARQLTLKIFMLRPKTEIHEGI